MRIAATAFVGMWLAGPVFGGTVLTGSGVALAQAPAAGERRASNGANTVPGPAASVVATNGEATLKLCRDWLITHDCREYGHIDIPRRIAVGDVFDVTFGSNPKTMRFKVKSVMARGAEGCLLVPAHEDMPKTPSTEIPADMLIVKDCTVER
ncbi:hypothetical protein [Azospirillum rugosum]|uniref:Uncharacterized protein n=1 Tax=Azospirillum rugosum TaxID=416170 RepID=A0ABS4SUS4_9PROT|nr:hypothetical protein [Azospirillum rugosum]MBP2295838.1 hypothetical protein [Azospirillum rugosum]MDQ0529051.1 hypothetical protein [Azospirillum rugosum]